ncbi:hypothetical protein EJD97_018436 [Solanum chilense]|uniref:Uncharacterized protein n=1 Tax=Solanum chilense TaxID=4083 RepID=A0A6N2CEA7_SOLCI|nr:hypothetical protein EJD97_018436 [Solanum chilense]
MFTVLSRYSPPLVSNPRDEMNRFVIGVTDLMREDCRKVMLHNDMTLARLMLYAQSIKESKFKRISRNFKRSGFSDQYQSRFNKRAQAQEEPKSSKVKLEKGGGSQNGNLPVSLVEIGIMKVDPNVPKDDVQEMRRFYALRTRGEKPDDDDDAGEIHVRGAKLIYDDVWVGNV